MCSFFASSRQHGCPQCCSLVVPAAFRPVITLFGLRISNSSPNGCIKKSAQDGFKCKGTFNRQKYNSDTPFCASINGAGRILVNAGRFWLADPKCRQVRVAIEVCFQHALALLLSTFYTFIFETRN